MQWLWTVNEQWTLICLSVWQFCSQTVSDSLISSGPWTADVMIEREDHFNSNTAGVPQSTHTHTNTHTHNCLCLINDGWVLPASVVYSKIIAVHINVSTACLSVCLCVSLCDFLSLHFSKWNLRGQVVCHHTHTHTHADTHTRARVWSHMFITSRQSFFKSYVNYRSEFKL